MNPFRRRCRRFLFVLVVFFGIGIVGPGSAHAFFEGAMQGIGDRLGWEEDPEWVRTTASVPMVTTLVVLMPPTALSARGVSKLGFEKTANGMVYGVLGLSAGTYELTAVPLRPISGHPPVQAELSSSSSSTSTKRNKSPTPIPSPDCAR